MPCRLIADLLDPLALAAGQTDFFVSLLDVDFQFGESDGPDGRTPDTPPVLW
jgi:hypothetical protein